MTRYRVVATKEFWTYIDAKDKDDAYDKAHQLKVWYTFKSEKFTVGGLIINNLYPWRGEEIETSPLIEKIILK